MNDDQLSLLFRCISLLFLILLGITLYTSFTKKNTKKLPILFGVLTALCFISIVVIIFYNANNDYYVQAAKANKNIDAAAKHIPNNVIFRDVALFISVGVRLAIVAAITGMFLYLWKKSKRYPNNFGIVTHKVLLLVGMALIGCFVVSETIACSQSAAYREVIPFGWYSAFFAGGIFYMFVCSIVLAAALPENYDAPKK